jgi:hypothetical protein
MWVRVLLGVISSFSPSLTGMLDEVEMYEGDEDGKVV